MQIASQIIRLFIQESRSDETSHCRGHFRPDIRKTLLMIQMVRHSLGCQESLRKLHHGKSLRIILAAIIRNDLTIIGLDLEQENGLDDFFFLVLHNFQEILRKLS